jgi:hypothetical protein
MKEQGHVHESGRLSPYLIGEPGSAAFDRSAGPPGPPIGLADAELSAASLPGMDIRAATVRGVLHRATGHPRQDAFALGHRRQIGRSGRAVVVVCDGVGALGRSQEAAMLVSRHLAALANAGVAWPVAFKEANDAIGANFAAAQLANPKTPDARDGMATTAIALLAHRDGGDWVIEAAWAGDSSLWHLGTDGTWTQLAGGTDDDPAVRYAPAAQPLPSTSGLCASAEFRVPGGAIFAMTDGVANPLRWSAQVAATLAAWWTSPPDPFTFAAQVGFARKAFTDDRTVAGIWPAEIRPPSAG